MHNNVLPSAFRFLYTNIMCSLFNSILAVVTDKWKLSDANVVGFLLKVDDAYSAKYTPPSSI